MTMIVAQLNSQWFLAAFAPHLNGCNLSTLEVPRSNADHFRLWNEWVWVWSHAPVDGIRFFPQALWRGTPVFIDMWSHGQDRPHIACTMNPAKIDQQQWFGRTGLSLVEMIGPCAELGLRLDVRDHAVYGAVPFDELELIEGPPPEGPF